MENKVKETTRVALFGLDSPGLEIIHILSGQEDYELVAAIDADCNSGNLSITEATGIVGFEETPVHQSFDEIDESMHPEAIFHTCGSSITDTIEDLRLLCGRGLSVVTSCEEMLFPWHRAPEPASEIDALCREHGGRLVSTGTGPGPALNLLPIGLAGLTRNVREIFAEVTVDARDRPGPVLERLGLGMDPAEFREDWANGKLGQYGFHEFVLIVAHAFGWHIPALDHWCEPIIADRPYSLEGKSIAAGQSCGIHQTIRAYTADRYSIRLELKMCLELENDGQKVRIEGDPPIEAALPAGIDTEKAAAASVVGALSRLRQLPPGLKLVTDLPTAADFDYSLLKN